MSDIEHVSAALPATAHNPEADHLNLLWKLARMTTNTEMVPKTLRGRPDAALAVMVYGHELKLQPMTSLREVFIIEGTPTCSAKLMRALIFRAGHKLEWRAQSRTKVVLYGERCDGRGSGEVTWEIEDAKDAGLLGKDVWKRYPRAMLKARATSELARDIFPDCTIGYTPEEMGRVDLSGDYDYLDVEGDDPADAPDENDIYLSEPSRPLVEMVDPDTGEIVDPAEWDDDDPANPLEDAAPVLPLADPS